jgi:O-antigen ligase
MGILGGCLWLLILILIFFFGSKKEITIKSKRELQGDIPLKLPKTVIPLRAR